MEADTPSPVRAAIGVVALFGAAGVGLGLATNFTLGFLIEQFVEPGRPPTDNTLVGIMLIHGIITPLLVGPLVAVVAGASVGRAFAANRLLGPGVAAVASVLGFYLMAGISLALTVLVLSQYAPAGGGGGASPLDTGALATAILEGAVPTALAAALAGYGGTRFG